jgi:hypothetical protein
MKTFTRSAKAAVIRAKVAVHTSGLSSETREYLHAQLASITFPAGFETDEDTVSIELTPNAKRRAGNVLVGETIVYYASSIEKLESVGRYLEYTLEQDYPRNELNKLLEKPLQNKDFTAYSE